MSYTGPEFDPPHLRRSPRRRTLAVALAALVPGALLGWLAYEALGGSGDGGPDRVTGAASSSQASPSGGADGDGKPAAPVPPSATASAPAGTGSLKGKVVVIDPGHNPGNAEHTAEINRQVDVGTHRKE